jgi:hypothetical protein
MNSEQEQKLVCQFADRINQQLASLTESESRGDGL